LAIWNLPSGPAQSSSNSESLVITKAARSRTAPAASSEAMAARWASALTPKRKSYLAEGIGKVRVGHGVAHSKGSQTVRL